MTLSIIIVSYNVREYLLTCLASVKQHIGDIEHEIIVVDNDSKEGSADAVEKEFPGVVSIRNTENVGFARGNYSEHEWRESRAIANSEQNESGRQ